MAYGLWLVVKPAPYAIRYLPFAMCQVPCALSAGTQAELIQDRVH